MAWNPPSSASSKSRAAGASVRQPTSAKKRAIIALVFLSLASSIALWFVFNGGNRPADPKAVVPEEPKKMQMVDVEVYVSTNKPATSSASSTNSASEVDAEGLTAQQREWRDKGYPRNPWGTPIPKDLEYKHHAHYTTEDYARIDPGFMARHERFLQRKAANPWKTRGDQQLAPILESLSGKQLGLVVPFSAKFKEDFLKSLETPIVISENDSPEVQQKKKDMIELKLALKERMDAGEDIVKTLNDECARLSKLNSLHENLRRELIQIQKTATSVEEVQDYVNAANKMLDDAGGKRITLPLGGLKLRLKRENGNK